MKRPARLLVAILAAGAFLASEGRYRALSGGEAPGAKGQKPAGMPFPLDAFKGINVERCKDIGGPPVPSAEGPRILSLSVAEGRKRDAVIIRGEGLDPKRTVEVHFLLKGRDVAGSADRAGDGTIRTRVPEMGSAVDGKGWIYLAYGNARGKAVPFLYKGD